MAVLLDSSFYIALRNGQDSSHERAKQLAANITEGAHGEAIVTDYLVAEALNFATSRVRFSSTVAKMAAELLGQSGDPWIRLAFVDQEVFAAAAELFTTLGVAKGLSFTDCTTIAFAKRNKIELVASFDSGFDGLLGRLS